MSKVKDPGRRDLRSCRGFPSVFCSRREVESRMSIVECGDCSATSGVWRVELWSCGVVELCSVQRGDREVRELKEKGEEREERER